MPGITSAKKKAVMSSIHSDFQPMAPGRILQIFLRVAIQDQIGIAQRVIVNKPLEYAQMVLRGEMEYYLSLGCDHGRLEELSRRKRAAKILIARRAFFSVNSAQTMPSQRTFSVNPGKPA